jgi:hypothetical protein
VIIPPDPQHSPTEGLLFGSLTMLVARTAVFLGVEHYRDNSRLLPACATR